jgi:hypothetical protein
MNFYPPIRPLSYPINRKPRHVKDVTAVKSVRPSRTGMLIELDMLEYQRV